MNLKKTKIDDIFKCYSCNALEIEGETKLVFAGEGPGVLAIYGGEDFSEKETLWDSVDECGGTMSIVTVQGPEGYFFVSKGFFSMVDSGTSAIYLVRYVDGEFVEEKVVDIPYLHRFDIITKDEHRYLVAASLHGGKVDKEDWSKPGKVYVTELPYDLDQPMDVELTVLKDGLYKNHGFNKGLWKGEEAVFIASESGVHAIVPPAETGLWGIGQIFDFPVSDVAVIDMDGDGEVEFALLSPFHGDGFDVYKKVDGSYKSVFQYEKAQDFYHAINADTVNGVPTFIIGARKDPMDLFAVQYDQESNCFKSILLETGVGSANARIIHTNDGDYVMASNRQIDQAAIYKA